MRLIYLLLLLALACAPAHTSLYAAASLPIEQSMNSEAKPIATPIEPTKTKKLKKQSAPKTKKQQASSQRWVWALAFLFAVGGAIIFPLGFHLSLGWLWGLGIGALVLPWFSIFSVYAKGDWEIFGAFAATLVHLMLTGTSLIAAGLIASLAGLWIGGIVAAGIALLIFFAVFMLGAIK